MSWAPLWSPKLRRPVCSGSASPSLLITSLSQNTNPAGQHDTDMIASNTNKIAQEFDTKFECEGVVTGLRGEAGLCRVVRWQGSRGNLGGARLSTPKLPV
ncbi:hypothetical protein KC19_VG034800 [Ceratodon purpureus]|uniref:Uncharacterized protein n=1 Tax=Ceratodon purpureus TaxID=3225 RepID=A0A8T0HLL9_CERPU|nr:hypothetical protein KC19_VG034800 [Ceratodon purpureus]